MNEEDKDKAEQSPLLDEEQLMMLIEAGASESGNSLFGEILDLFEQESALKIREIRESHEAGDFDRMGRSSHALAGSSANIGGLEVWRMAKEIENLCKADRGREAGTRLDELEATYAATMQALRAHVAAN